MTNHLNSSPATQELRDYYKKKFNFDDVDFIIPHTENGLEILGEIRLSRNGIHRTIEITDLFTKGFDGIDDVLGWWSSHWNSPIYGVGNDPT